MLVVLSVGAWACLSGVNGPATVRWGLVLACAAAAAAWVMVVRGRPAAPSRAALIAWAVAGGAGSALLQGAWRWSWLALMLSSVLLVLPLRGLGRPRLALWMWARQLAVAGALLLLLAPVWARVHALPGLPVLLLPLLRLAGAPATAAADGLRVGGYPQAATIPTSPQHLALDLALLMFAALLLSGASGRMLGRFAFACLLWLPVRYVLLVLTAVQTLDASAFYRPAVVAASLLPLAPLTSWLGGAGASSTTPAVPPAPGESPRGWTSWWRDRRGESRAAGAAGVALCLLAGACLGTGLFFADPGRPKGDRLLIDESHGPWESTLVPMTDRALDALSSYNYYWLGRWLRNYYRVSTHNSGPLTAGALAACDILLVKTPTQPFTTEEIASIREFVRGGGGLWIIGDHTDVFGVTTFANPLAEAFGVQFLPDATYDLGVAGLPLWVPPPYPVHPAARQIKQTYMVHTSCTMAAASGSAPMIGWGWRGVAGDYSRAHFFPGETAKKLEFGFGSYALLWTRAYGRGRVAVCADSTIWSNFLMFIPGKPEFVLGVMSWLGRSNTYGRVPAAALAAAVGLLLVAGVLGLLGWGGLTRRELALGALTAGCLLAALACAANTRRAYPDLPFRSADPVVSFEGQYSDLFLQIRRFYDTYSRSSRTYHTMFVWAQRVGLVPRYADTLGQALAQAQAVVLINPTRALSPADRAALQRYLQGGGRLLLLLGRATGSSDPEAVAVANALLQPWGLRVTATTPVREAKIGFAEGDGCAGAVGETIAGGTALASSSGRPVAAVQPVGRGLVVAATCAAALTNARLGEPASRMTESQKGCSRLSFTLYRALQLRSDEGRAYYEQ